MTAEKKSLPLPAARLQRGLGVALWRQIADGIRSGLAEGLADASGRLPPESELAIRFGVNRHTVRAAIAALAHEGVLHSVQGSGTFARRRKRLVYPIGARTRFSAGFEGQTRDRQTQLLDHAREAAGAEVADALGIAVNDEVMRLDLRGTADGMPVSRATSWFAAVRFPTIVATYLETRSVTAALAALGVNDYLRASTGVEARHADEADASELQLAPGAIVLVTRALNVDRDGAPVHFSITRFPADRVELVIDTLRAGG